MVPVPTPFAASGAHAESTTHRASLSSPHSFASLAQLPRRRKVFFGALASSKSALELELIEHAILAVDEQGVIVFKHNVGPRVHELANLSRDDPATSPSPPFSPPMNSQPDAALGTSYDTASSRVRHTAVTAQELAAESASAFGWEPESYDVIYLGHGDFLMPGMVDTHTHACQMPNMGVGQQYELLDWLQNVTFPREAKYADKAYARRAYASIVQRVLNAGTTTACYYASLHLEATKVLAEICTLKGQRALVGKCQMNANSPDYYCEASTEQSMQDTRAFITYCRSLAQSDRKAKALPALDDPLPSALVQPILTPRFAISCTSDLLQAVGDEHKADPTLRIQTHTSENAGEVAFTKTLFAHAADTYVGIYDHYGILTSKTVLAHAVHLEESEMQLIAKRQCGISHCPTSNMNIRSGHCRVAELLNRGIKVGLGTDVSGGYGISILSAVRDAAATAKTLTLPDLYAGSDEGQDVGKDAHPVGVFNLSRANKAPVAEGQHDFTKGPLPIATLFFLATLGSAQVATLDNTIGSLEVGKAFDALHIHLDDPYDYDDEYATLTDELDDSPQAFHEPEFHYRSNGLWAHPYEDDLDELVERFLFCGDDRAIRSVYVQGRRVDSKVKVAQPV